MLDGGQLDPGEQSSAKDELRALAQRVTSSFAIPPNEDQLFAPLTEVMANVGQPFGESGRVLKANISGLISAVSMPYTLANRSSVDRHWQRIYSAARIRSLKLYAAPGERPEDLDLRREREAQARAQPEMDSFLRSAEGRDAVISDTLGFLERLYADEPLAGAANELILQGVVLCWGAFEVLARDCFTEHLNVNPNRALTLLEDQVAKRRFELSKISLETLAAHNFDLSARMGTLLAQQQDLSDIYSIKAVYQALFAGNADLRDALNDSDLRLLSLRRNLIIHRRGIIDVTYAAASNCSQRIGERLRLTPDELETHVGTIIKAASSILEAVSAVR